MAQEFGEKTEAPTPKRKRKAVEDGQLLKSRDFATALVIWSAAAGSRCSARRCSRHARR
ncbi:MAG: EscU/YscU/HrcU family type III secretion system export apparatus switch protein [Sphingomonas sp.]